MRVDMLRNERSEWSWNLWQKKFKRADKQVEAPKNNFFYAFGIVHGFYLWLRYEMSLVRAWSLVFGIPLVAFCINEVKLFGAEFSTALVLLALAVHAAILPAVLMVSAMRAEDWVKKTAQRIGGAISRKFKKDNRV